MLILLLVTLPPPSCDPSCDTLVMTAVEAPSGHSFGIATHLQLSNTVEWCIHGMHAAWCCCVLILLLVTLPLPSCDPSCDTLVMTAVEAPAGFDLA
jgi:hypothetical protein